MSEPLIIAFAAAIVASAAFMIFGEDSPFLSFNNLLL